MGYKKRVTKHEVISGTKVIVKKNNIELAIKKFKNKMGLNLFKNILKN